MDPWIILDQWFPHGSPTPVMFRLMQIRRHRGSRVTNRGRHCRLGTLHREPGSPGELADGGDGMIRHQSLPYDSWLVIGGFWLVMSHQNDQQWLWYDNELTINSGGWLDIILTRKVLTIILTHRSSSLIIISRHWSSWINKNQLQEYMGPTPMHRYVLC